MSIQHKQLFLSILLLVMIAVAFWMSSRYPALNEKAMMGGDFSTSGISFDNWLEVNSGNPLWEQLLINTLNWLYTNRQGMTFGLLFAAALMLLLSTLQRKHFNNLLANSMMGMIIGAPLGVCVNCAAPIAEGVQRAGGHVATAVAIMTSSPTMNIIVLTMLFALFPLYMVVIKISLTLVFILVAIPFLVKWLAKNDEIAANEQDKLLQKAGAGQKNLLATNPGSDIQNSWAEAVKWAGLGFIRNFWSVIKLTLPLMLLAGLIGNVLITFFPWEYLAFTKMPTSFMLSVIIMGVITLIGLVLPVPMAFDVIIVAILLAGDVPERYAVILLFTLGIFSIYPWLLLRRSVSLGFASAIFLVLAGLGMLAGFSGHYYARYDLDRSIIGIMESAKKINTLKILRLDLPQAKPPDVQWTQLYGEMITSPTPAGKPQDPSISIRRFSFLSSQGEGAALFEKIEGPELGIVEANSYSIYDYLPPTAHTSGLASGDIDKDGWIDLLVSHEDGLTLYRNAEGKRFLAEPISIPGSDQAIFSTASLVDLDNDGWLDIFVAIYRKGNYVIYNKAGQFATDTPQLLPNHPSAVLTVAPAFGDLDRDGQLEIFLGNWTLGTLLPNSVSHNASRNALLIREHDSYKLVPMDAIKGETLSTMITDFNQDDLPDLIVGNDFHPPDIFYTGNGSHALKTIQRSDIERSTHLTMSIATADIDNDLKPEIYLTAVSRQGLDPATHFRTPEAAFCNDIDDPAYHRFCREVMQNFVGVYRAHTKSNLGMCPKGWEYECIAAQIYQMAKKQKVKEGSTELCDLYPSAYEQLKWLCEFERFDSTLYTKDQLAAAIPFIRDRNVLLKSNSEGKFIDQAEQFGIHLGGWSWNGKFADLNNDEWPDLYIVNGYIISQFWDQKIFYQNHQGKHFTDQTEAAGLSTFLPIQAYTYLDYDHDGDLDIIAAPYLGPILVYRNTQKKGRAIMFELHDQIGNYYGIGSKVIIRYGKRHQMREIQASGGFKSFDAPIAWFGLGEHQRVDQVEIRWSTGGTTLLDMEFKAGAKYIITRHSEIN